LPQGRRGARRVDDQRAISGIMHILRSGGRWKDCPAICGPSTTVYNRWNRWCRQGVWERIFYALTGSTGVFAGAVDSTHIRLTARRRAKKVGLIIMLLAPARRADHQNLRAKR